MPAPAYSLLRLIALAASGIALVFAWLYLGRTQPLPEPVAGHKLQCVSYSPFGKRQSPFDQPFEFDAQRVEADLAQLATRFSCIRTYSAAEMREIPAIARRQGLKVMLGAWVSADPAATQREIEALVQQANQHADVVSAVIVGNEALLRREITGPALATLIEQVKAQVTQPVTYADVWEFWLKHPEVAPTVDFISIHLLPYWEDEPLAAAAALSRVGDIRRLFGETFAPKPIFIGETGWPSEGRQRETAVASRHEAALFLRGFLARAEAEGWDYNLIEAYDQPWKRQSEGAVGGYWGLFDADRADKGLLQGPVSNLPDWRFWLGLSLAVQLAALWLAGRPASVRAALALPALGALGGLCLALSARESAIVSRYADEWLWALALLGLQLVVLAHAALTLGQRQGRREKLFEALEKRAGWWLLAAGFAGAVTALALVFDARYRSFPSVALLLPTLVYLLRPASAPRREIALLAALLAACIAPQLYQETLANAEALGWAGVSALLVTALLRSLRRSPRDELGAAH